LPRRSDLHSLIYSGVRTDTVNPKKHYYPCTSRLRLCFRRLVPILALLMATLLLFSCKHKGPAGAGEVMYVSVPQSNLRDRVATIYNRVGSVKNGDRVIVLEHQRRFARVRTDDKQEGWIELRALVPHETYDQFEQLRQDNRSTPAQGRGVTRVELNMHVAPGRETDTLYQLAEGAKLEMLKRATATRATPEEIAARRAAQLARLAGEPVKPAPKKRSNSSATHAQPTGTQPNQSQPNQTQPNQSQPNQAQPSHAQPNQPQPDPAQGNQSQASPKSALAPKTANPAPSHASAGAPPQDSSAQPPEAQPKPMDDWWLVRDQQGHTGWVLARMVDADIPLDVVQYAEGQRIQAAFVLNTVQDQDKGKVAQYLVLMNENHDGIPYDFNQVRVFTWNLRKHRYETGYRERYIIGYLPALISTEDFGREGTMPVFTIRKQNEDGSITERKYRLIGNIVRPVLAPGEVTPPAAHSPDQPKKTARAEKKARKRAASSEKEPLRSKHGAHHGRKQ
jgi:SH3-like domain-containing protein